MAKIGFFVVDDPAPARYASSVGASTPICNLNPGHQPEAATIENQVPVFGYLFGVIACGESVDALPEAGTFFDTNMRIQIANTASEYQGHVEKLPNGTCDLLGNIAAIAQEFADEAGMTIDDWIAELVRAKASRSNVSLPSNVVAAIAESLGAVDADETLEEFIASILAEMLTDVSGFFEARVDDDPAISATLAEIRRRHGLSKAEAVAA